MKINSKNRGFVEGTLVLMADGSQKPIEQIKTGDMVLSFDEFDSTAPLESMRVTNTFSRIDSDILEVKVGENILKVAKDQMFIGPHNDWKEVYNHSLVVDLEGTPVKYTVNQNRKGKHRVYDITVEENHSLIANGLRVHNVAGGAGGLNTQQNVSSGSSARKTSSTYQGGPMAGQRVDSPKSPSVPAKATKTPKDSPGSPKGAGKTSTQSANNSLGSRNNSGADREGGGNRDVGMNRTNTNNKKVSNGAKGYKKSPKKVNDEPAPSKPNGSSVAIKLLETVDNNVDVLQGLIDSFTPAQLTTAKITVQSGVDSIYSFTNSYVAALYASELNVYDKTELIQIATQIMSAAADLRDPFEETVVTAAGKKIATVYLALIEANVSLSLEKLGAEVVNDGRGGLEVTVNNQPSSKKVTPKYTKKTYTKPVKTSNGKYTTTKKKPNRKVRGKTQSSAPARNIYEV